jgi:hypothetical protein
VSKAPKFCTTCGASLSDDALTCPQCGNELHKTAGASLLNAPSERNIPNGPKGGFTDHLTTGFNVALSNPIIFVPALIGGVLEIILSSVTTGMLFLSLMTLLSIISTAISFILGFASIDLARNAYDKKSLDLGSSIGYVFKRFGSFIVAAIIGAVLTITVILIPVAVLMFVIMVVDETGIFDALGKAFKVLFADLGDIIVILVVAVVGTFLFGFIPLLSTFLIDALYVVISVACIDLYKLYNSK